MKGKLPKILVALTALVITTLSPPGTQAQSLRDDNGSSMTITPHRDFIVHADLGRDTKYDETPTTYRYTLKVYHYNTGIIPGLEQPDPLQEGYGDGLRDDLGGSLMNNSEWRESLSQTVVSNSRTCTFADVPMAFAQVQYVAIVEALPRGSDVSYSHPHRTITYPGDDTDNQPIDILITDPALHNNQYERLGASAGTFEMGNDPDGEVDIYVPCVTTGVRVVTDADYLAALPEFDHFEVSYQPLADRVSLCAPNDLDPYPNDYVRTGMNDIQMLETHTADRITYVVPKPTDVHSNGLMTVFYDYMLSPNDEDIEGWNLQIKCLDVNGAQVGEAMTAPMRSRRGYNNLVTLDMPQPAITASQLVGKGVGVHVKRYDHGQAVYNNTCATLVPGTGNDFTLQGVRLEPYMHSPAGTYPKMDIKLRLEGSKLYIATDEGKKYQTVPAYDDHGQSMGVRYLSVLDPEGHDIGTGSTGNDFGDEPIGLGTALRFYTWTHWAQRNADGAGQIFTRPDGTMYVHFNFQEGPLTYSDTDPEILDNTAYVVSDNTADNMPLFTGLDLYLYTPNTTVVYTDNLDNEHTVKGLVDFYPRGSGRTFDDGHNLHLINIFGEGWPLKDANGVERPVYGDVDWDNLTLTIPRQPITPDLRHNAIFRYSGPEWGGNGTNSTVFGRIGTAFMPTVDASARTMLQASDGGDISMRLTSQYAHDHNGHPITLWQRDCGGQLTTYNHYTAETIEPWNTVCGTTNANGLGWHSLRLTPFSLGRTDESLKISNDFQLMGCDDKALYVKGQLNITDNEHHLDYIELFVMPGTTLSVDENHNLCTENGYDNAINISSYTIDWNLDGDDVLDLLQNRGTGTITYNQCVPMSVLRNASRSDARVQSTNPLGYTLFAKAHYVHDALQPTFHALASHDQTTTDLDDAFASDKGQFTAVAVRGYIEVTADTPVSIHTPAGACLYNGVARRLDMPSGIYLVSDGLGHTLRLLVK